MNTNMTGFRSLTKIFASLLYESSLSIGRVKDIHISRVVFVVFQVTEIVSAASVIVSTASMAQPVNAPSAKTHVAPRVEKG